MIFLLFPS